MNVGLLTLSFHLQAMDSLKQKRSVVKRLLAEVDRHGTAFAACEVSDGDDLHRLTLRIAHVSNDAQYTDSALRRLQQKLEVTGGYAAVEARIEVL